MVNVTTSSSVPDDVTLQTNSGGKLEIIDNGVTLAKLAGGTAAKAIGFDVSGDPAEISAGEWTHIETITLASAASFTTTGTLPVYDFYRVDASWNSVSASGFEDAFMRVNGQTGGIYNYQHIDANAVVSGASQTGIFLCRCDDAGRSTIHVLIEGKTSAYASSLLGVMIHGTGAIRKAGINGTASLGNAVQLTSITIYTASDLWEAGQMEIYGRNAK